MSNSQLHFIHSIDFYLLVQYSLLWQLSGFGPCSFLLLLLMLFFPAANVNYTGFCVNKMWLKRAELHPEEASGGAGVDGDMRWYVLVCIFWHMEEWTARWTTGKGGWSCQHEWIWEAGEKRQQRKKCMTMAFSWAKSNLFACAGLSLPTPVPKASTASD